MMEEPFDCEMIKRGEETSICWVEVSPGLRVRSLVDTCIIPESIQEGDDFLWFQGSNKAIEKPPAYRSKRLEMEIEALRFRMQGEIKRIADEYREHSEDVPRRTNKIVDRESV